MSVFLFAATTPELRSMIPTDTEGWLYYGLCAVFFLLCGLITGFFVWRKGHMQTLDAEAEVERTAEELTRLRGDLESEELGVADAAASERKQG